MRRKGVLINPRVYLQDENGFTLPSQERRKLLDFYKNQMCEKYDLKFDDNNVFHIGMLTEFMAYDSLTEKQIRRFKYPLFMDNSPSWDDIDIEYQFS
jgi:hypothetical protein